MSSAAPLPAFPLRQALVCGGIATLVDVAIGAHWLPSVFHGALFNPDSYMRLARLDDILVAHAPIDVVARDGSGAGTVLYWSHLLDTLLLVLAVPLAPFLGEHEALRWAGVLLGPLSAGLLGMALGWAAAPLSEPARRWTAALSGSLAIPVIAVLAARCRASPHACRACGGDVRWLGGTFRVRRSPRRQKAGRLGMLRVVAEPRSDADRAHVTWRRRSRLAAAP